MAKVYASLIRKGLKTLDQVPAKLKEEVEQILYESGYFNTEESTEEEEIVDEIDE